MQDPPNWQQLVTAVAQHLQAELIPAIHDPGLRFRTRIAANLLAIVQRELQLAPSQARQQRQRLEQLLDEPGSSEPLVLLNRRLQERVAAGQFDRGPERARLMQHLKASAMERLQIANPKFLARLEAEDQQRVG